MYKLIALDMDGTLFNSDKQITDRTKETLAQARALGVKIVLASGRPLAGLQPPLQELDLIHEGEYVLSFNGALIVDAKTGEAVSKCILKGSDYKKLFKLAQELGVHCQAFSPSRGLITNETSQYTEHEASINQIDINIINPLTDITDEEDIIKVMFIDPPEILDEAIAKLPTWIKEDFNVFKSAPFFLEITHKDVDKGAGLLHLDLWLCAWDGDDVEVLPHISRLVGLLRIIRYEEIDGADVRRLESIEGLDVSLRRLHRFDCNIC